LKVTFVPTWRDGNNLLSSAFDPGSPPSAWDLEKKGLISFPFDSSKDVYSQYFYM
jgi:hypothetical protein